MRWLLTLLVALPAFAERPNVLVVVADDCTMWDLGSYGGQAATPHLDQLCAEGMRFDRCFQAAPMCSPTRHCLYTGLYPVKSGAWPNHTRSYPAAGSVVADLVSAGYRVGLSGKSHVDRSGFPFEVVHDRAEGNFRASDPDEDAISAWFAACKAEGTPFCLFACSNEPHTPWDRGDASAYPPAELALPPHYVDTPATRDAFSRYLAEITFFDGQVGRLVALLDEHGLRESTLVIVLSEQGNAFPFAKWTCYEAGLASGMVVRWPGQVPAGTTTEALVEYVDIGPTLLEAAGATTARELDGTSFLPVLRGETQKHDTFVFGLQTSRGINNGPHHYGIRAVRNTRFRYVVNLTPDATFQNAVDKQEWFKEWLVLAEAGDARAAALIDRHRHRPAEELFDVVADPWCLRNLADHEEHQDVKKKLRRVLGNWMSEQGDAGQITELRAKERQGRGR